MQPVFSIIIPAHNEETALGATLDRLIESANMLGEPYEIIVVDDDSSDGTASVAQQRNAQVVSVKLRQIAAVRNAGAKHASGTYLIFVDADTLVPEPTLWAAAEALRSGAAGGGALVRFDDDVPMLAQAIGYAAAELFYWLRIATGCFVFARRDAFEAIGGFDERFYASEEVWISKALKRHGRFVVLRDVVITSGRKIRMHGMLGLLGTMLRLAIGGPRAWQRRDGLDFWYDGRREPSPHHQPPLQ